MVQVRDNTFRVLDGSGSYTIPSGVVFSGAAFQFYAGNDGIAYHKGYTFIRSNSTNRPTAVGNIVLTEGTTISHSSSTTLALMGSDVSGFVDNEPIDTVVGPNDSLSIPSGETWQVHALTTYDGINDGNLELNNTRLNSSNGMERKAHTSLILKGGDTLTQNNGATHLWGFKQ